MCQNTDSYFPVVQLYSFEQKVSSERLKKFAKWD